MMSTSDQQTDVKEKLLAFSERLGTYDLIIEDQEWLDPEDVVLEAMAEDEISDLKKLKKMLKRIKRLDKQSNVVKTDIDWDNVEKYCEWEKLVEKRRDVESTATYMAGNLKRKLMYKVDWRLL